MDEVILFDKTLQQRLQDFEDVFSGTDNLHVSAIQKEWSFYLEFELDSSGWQAMWKIQRRTCERFNIPFPSIVLVYILRVDLDELSALVKVLAVQDDIHIPDKHNVPLVQLWPTKHQEKSIALNLHSTANSLDMLRFFYTNLFMPWDYEEDGDWRTKHLESRLRLFYDMKFGIIPRGTADHLHSLMTEARRLQVKQEILEVEVEELEEQDERKVNLNSKHVQTLTELHLRMMEIKAEYEILENPLLRSAVIKKQKEMSPKNQEIQQKIWVVFDQGSASESIEFLSKVQQQFSDDILCFSPQLNTTLEVANPDDIFILKETTHSISSTGALEQGGIMKGLSVNRSTILTSKSENIMLDFQCDKVFLENITIDANAAQCAIIVRKGTLSLNNCKLVGDGKSSTHQGIIVLSGAALDLTDCEITNFCTAIVGNSGSQIVIKNSEIHSCNYGLKIFDNCALTAIKAIIRNCKDYGICVETENNLEGEQPKIGDFDTLSIIPTMQIEFMTGMDNAKGDAVINQKSKLRPVEDFFENPDLDPTICFGSDEDEEMELQHNSTVIESGCEGRTSPVTI